MAITNLSNYSQDSDFLYRLLSRLKQDCDYYLGNGSRSPRRLWALNERDHINEMYEIYNYLDEKPEWLTLDQLDNYKKEMLCQK